MGTELVKADDLAAALGLADILEGVAPVLDVLVPGTHGAAAERARGTLLDRLAVTGALVAALHHSIRAHPDSDFAADCVCNALWDELMGAGRALVQFRASRECDGSA